MTDNPHNSTPAGNANEGIKPAPGARFSAPLQGISVQDKQGGNTAKLAGILVLALGIGGGYYIVDTMLARAPVQPGINLAATAPTDTPAPETAPVVETAAASTEVTADAVQVTDTALAPAETAAAPAPVAPAAADAAPPADLPAPADAAEPSAAEVALVQNAAVLDGLASTPPPAATDAIAPADAGAIANVKNPPEAEQEALIRPLPKQYLIVKKNHDAGDADAHLTSARLALMQNRPAAALQLFNEMYRENPRDKRILMGRAVSLQRMGQNGEALTAYEEALEADPKNLEALTNMLGLLKAQNPALAVEKLSELREAYPYNADITAQLGIAYGGQGNYDQASKYLEMAEALKPDSAYVLYNKAVLFDRMGRTTEAADLYRQIVRLAAEGHLDASLPIETIKRRLSTIK